MHNCTLKRNGDTITFQEPTSSQFYTVTYFFGYDSYTEVKTRTVHEAQSRWNKAVDMGFVEMQMPEAVMFFKNSKYDF